MNDLVCFERAGAYVRARLAEPGVLRGRQRGKTYADQAVQFMVYLLGKHARAEHEHVFPLSRMPMGGLVNLGLTEWTIRRLIPKMVEAGFIEPVNGLKRRYETGTRSPTEGAKGSWWFPRLFKLSAALRAIFGKSPSMDISAAPLECQCDQNETLNLSEEGTQDIRGGRSEGSQLLVASAREEALVMAAVERLGRLVLPERDAGIQVVLALDPRLEAQAEVVAAGGNAWGGITLSDFAKRRR